MNVRDFYWFLNGWINRDRARIVPGFIFDHAKETAMDLRKAADDLDDDNNHEAREVVSSYLKQMAKHLEDFEGFMKNRHDQEGAKQS